MYYRLNKDFLLRGWDKRTGNIVHKISGLVIPVPDEMFQTLLLCDGETDISDDMLTEGMKDVLAQMEKQRFVSRCKKPNPISDEQHYRYYKNRCVNSVIWSLTGRCNYRCRHCYMDAPDAKFGELTHEEAIDLIDQMVECGIVRVDVTGGEPLVRPDFWELVDYMLAHNIGIGQIYTNGWLVDEEFFKQMKKRDMRSEISVSFDGIGCHDWMRGVTGAEERAIRALKLAVKHGHPVSVQMCVHKGNISTLRETVRRLSEIGVHDLRIGNVSQTDLWKKNSEGNDMTTEEYLDAMLKYIPEFYEDGMPMNILISSVIRMVEKSAKYEILPEHYCGNESCLNVHLCGAVKSACYITPEGRLLPCMPMTACEDQSVFPLISDIGLKNGLTDSFYMQFVDSRVKDLLAVNEQCSACGFKYRCGGGCRANAMMASNNGFMASDPVQCIIWKNGYPDRIRESAEKAIIRYCPGKKSVK